MELFTVVIAIAFIQIWGNDNPLHKDDWFHWWLAKLNQQFHSTSLMYFAVSVFMPALVLAIVIFLLDRYSGWLVLPLGVAVLLYSFGRGEFNGIVTEYTKACSIEDWPTAIGRAARIGVRTDDLSENDWNSLHSHVLDEAGYRGFERMFAILFWFLLLGPIAAFVYRLIFLFNRKYLSENYYAHKLLWLIEWPAVRVLGLSFALTGNFVGCYGRFKECLFCAKRKTIEVLSPMILGALSVDDELSQTCEVTRKELTLLERLYTRTLWLWLTVASVLIVFV